MPHLAKTVSSKLANTLAVSLARLTVPEIESIARLTAQQAAARNVDALNCFAKAFVAGAGTPSDPERSGEFELIERTARLGFGLAFDVGANVGNWTRHFCDHHRNAEVHCFEIVPETFARLQERLGNAPAPLVLNPFGLSDADGTVDVFVSEDDLVSSIHARADGLPKRKQACRVRRGADYARERGIERIDLLKIDVEGAEGRVLEGMADYFDRRQIRLVQFEYNWFAIESRFLLADCYEFLTRRGYIVGRLTRDGVIFSDYRYALEDFCGPNYVGCLPDDGTLIAAIEAPR